MDEKKQQEFLDLLKTVSDKGKFEQTCALAKFVLNLYEINSEDKAKSGIEIYNLYCNALKEIPGWNGSVIIKNTFITNLGLTPGEGNTDIYCKGRKKGYYVATELYDDLNEEESTDESTLYPLFQNWLTVKGFVSRVVAGNKKNGKWGNPDVFGIKAFDMLGRNVCEFISVECKRSMSQWKYWIFEAVSHTRFCDRSYFAFPCPVDEIPKKSRELIQYAEYFGVGILLVGMDRAEYEKYVKGGNLPEDPEIVELYPAPLSHPFDTAKKEFLESLKIRSLPELFEFLNNDKVVE